MPDAPNGIAKKLRLSWYVIHEAQASVLDELIKRKLEPVLDYSGGVGNNIMHLAKKGIQCHYFVIGMIEYAFAEFRVAKNNLTDLVEFKKPYSPKTGYRFDSITSALPGDGSLGAILAMDVLEHIPKYHLVVKEMVDSLQVGGVIAEKSPFDNRGQNGEDVRMHVSNGGVSMKDAMGPRMNVRKIWKRSFLGQGQRIGEAIGCTVRHIVNDNHFHSRKNKGSQRKLFSYIIS